MSMITQPRRWVSRRHIGGSLLLVCLLPLLPLPTTGWHYLPDLVGLTLLYWLIHQPQRASFATAFVVGVLMDIVMHVPFGQHALSYIFLVYGVLWLRPAYILMHGFIFQSLLIGFLLCGAYLLNYALRFVTDGVLTNATYFIPPLLSACLWALFNKIMLLIGHKRLIKRR